MHILELLPTLHLDHHPAWSQHATRWSRAWTSASLIIFEKSRGTHPRIGSSTLDSPGLGKDHSNLPATRPPTRTTPGGFGSCQTCALDRPQAKANEQRGKRMLLLKGTVCTDRGFASHFALVYAVGTWRPRDEREVKEVAEVSFVVVDKVGRRIACVRWGTQLRSRQPGRRLMMTGVSPL